MTGPARILVADDDPDLRDIVRSVLEPAGFVVSEAADGEAAVQYLRSQPADLLILDYTMPRLTGPQVCERVRSELALRHLPIIMLTGKVEVQDKVSGINAGADDYVIKPFEPQELLARVRMVLRRTPQGLEANPLTKLPGNETIREELDRRLAAGGPLAVCYLDLNQFKAFNDHYGFQRGDEVIHGTAALLASITKREGGPGVFLGHIGGDDFLIITTPDQSVPVCEAVVREFDAMAPTLYDEADRARGYLRHTDRKGQLVNVPLLSIAIAVVTNEDEPLAHPGQIAARAAELKGYAKQFDRSAYVKERRRPPA